MRNVGPFMLSMGVLGSGDRISPLLISYSRWMRNEVHCTIIEGRYWANGVMLYGWCRILDIFVRINYEVYNNGWKSKL